MSAHDDRQVQGGLQERQEMLVKIGTRTRRALGKHHEMCARAFTNLHAEPKDIGTARCAGAIAIDGESGWV